VTFVFDRPRRSTVLGRGLDRLHGFLLMSVRLHLPRLIEHTGTTADPELFLRKLASLARLAVSAAVQKRQFLRKHAGAQLGREFLLERARLVVVPVGLETAVRTLTGQSLCAGSAGMELARQIVASLAANLRSESPRAGIESCVDAAGGCADELASFTLAENARTPDMPGLHEIAGVSPWDAEAPPRVQLKAAGLLHEAAGAGNAGVGCAAVLVSRDAPPTAADALDLLHYAWKQTDVARLRFVRLSPRQKELAW